MRHSYAFVVPDPRTTITGGNLYNLRLTAALRAAGAHVRLFDNEAKRPEGQPFVDSLYLRELPRFAPCRLLAHYLPALVEGRQDLSSVERAALLAADAFVVPSEFMARALARVAPEPRPCVVVAPGIEVDHARLPRTSRAVLVANLVPGKGVLPLLRALARRSLSLAVIGSFEHDPAYAAECRAAAPDAVFLGPRSHEETIAEIAASDFLISASRMESFGLALAEARALGVPIVARAGGNAAAHVDEAAGGKLALSDEELAEECLRLARDRTELQRRRRAALANTPPPRTWADAARDFLSAFKDSSREG